MSQTNMLAATPQGLHSHPKIILEVSNNGNLKIH